MASVSFLPTYLKSLMLGLLLQLQSLKAPSRLNLLPTNAKTFYTRKSVKEMSLVPSGKNISNRLPAIVLELPVQSVNFPSRHQ